jgi:hypothetical protein
MDEPLDSARRSAGGLRPLTGNEAMRSTEALKTGYSLYVKADFRDETAGAVNS